MIEAACYGRRGPLSSGDLCLKGQLISSRTIPYYVKSKGKSVGVFSGKQILWHIGELFRSLERAQCFLVQKVEPACDTYLDVREFSDSI